MSSAGTDRVKLGFVTVRRSVLGAEPSGPRGLLVNWGHSEDFSLESRPLFAKCVRGDVWEMCARSNAAEAADI